MKITRRDFIKQSAGIAAIAALGDLFFNIDMFAIEESLRAIPYAPIEDVLIPSTDVMCVNFCGIRVRRVNGVIRAIYGNPASPYNKGHLCPKGQAGIFQTYNPYRVKKPLKRTNPNKDPREDPRWKEISWEEALNEIAGKLKDLRARNPQGLTFHWGHGKYLIQDQFLKAFCKAFGTPNNVHRTTVCEAARHVADELTWGGHGILPDLDETRYFISMGSNFAEGEQWARWLDRTAMRRIVDEREMKMVVVEPRLSNIAAKAAEWIPIRPGKDVVFLLGMAKELIKKDYIDRDFLTKYTNAAFLVGPDQKLLRDNAGNPLVWDQKSATAVPYDLAEEIALDTEVEVKGQVYKTAFRIFKDYVLSLQDREIEDITGVPYRTVERIAEEFGRNARIGETVERDGEKLRYRPVAIYTFRGLSAKEYGTQNWRAGLMVNMLVGALDAVGGLLLHKADPNYKNRKPAECEYPPTRVDLAESVFYPYATHDVAEQPALTYLNPEKYGLPYKPEMAIFYATNRLMSTADIEKQIEGFKKIYSVNINLVLDETTQMADIVLPDKTYLEDWHYSPTRWTPDSSHKAIRQPIVNPYNLKYGALDILFELAKRAGFLDEFIEEINKAWKLTGDKQFQKGKVYDSREAVRILWEAETGKPFDVAIQHGLVAKKTDVKTRYLSNAEKFNGKGKPKIHFYAEQLVFTREKVVEVMQQHPNVRQVFMEWYEEDDEQSLKQLLKIKFSPIPLKEHSLPTPHGKRDASEYPFYLITYKRMYRNQTDAHNLNPVLNEVAHDADTNFVLMNTRTAESLGISDGDSVYIESKIGKVSGIAKLTQGIRPDTVAISYHYGRFSQAFPEFAKKGTMPNFIIEFHPDIISGHNSFNDTRVKVYKI